MTRVLFTLKSQNSKTGPIPVSTTTQDTCPPACPFMGSGCYAESGPMSFTWKRLTRGGIAGKTWHEFCAMVEKLPSNQLWRHNQAGDLPGRGNTIDIEALGQLVAANVGKRGFTYTHKPVGFHDLESTFNAKAVYLANQRGFTVNLSADSLSEADELARLKIGPVVVVLPRDAPDKGNRTPAGRHVVVCPAQLKDGITCETCKLCAIGSRKSIVGFKAHGAMHKKVSLKVLAA